MGSTMRSPDGAWRVMIAIDVSLFFGLFAYKLCFNQPYVEYQYLLVTYHFGFAKRALIGTILSLFTAKISITAVYVLGLATWLVAVGLFILAFKRIFGLHRRNAPLFAFILGSPFFLKNFMYSIGYFDIYGCIVGFIALLIPVGALYPLVIGAACVLLVLIHHLQFLLYLPTICFIVFIRYFWLSDRSAIKLLYGFVLALMCSVVFIAAAFFGDVPVPRETLIAYVQQRATDYFPPDVSIWYSTISEEIQATRAVFHRNAWRIPVFLALIALHLPVIRWFRSMITARADADRRMIVTAIVAITIGYFIIAAVVFDYSRWVCNWAVCMLLVMHAVRLMPSVDGIVDDPIEPASKTNLLLGSIVTLIPRVGITKPF